MTHQAISFKIFDWFHRHGYKQGVFWIIVVALISSINDVLMRLLQSTGTKLPFIEIAFFRFFFAFLTLLPLMIWQGKVAFKTSKPFLHILRAILGFGAVALWCMGVSLVPLSIASILAMTVPIFVLPMAVLFLGEKVGWQRTIATLTGFLGIAVIINESSEILNFFSIIKNLDDGTIFILSATLLFAFSDILNKKMVIKESTLTMLFYFAAGTSLCGIIPAYFVWKSPSIYELFCLFLLGSGGNLILYCLLKAFAATDVSALAPYRYVELIFACFFGFILFNEIPTFYTLMGAIIIIPSTFAIAYYETHQRKISKLKIE